MLIAFLTDLHANREAVSACLAHAKEQSVTQYAFLGDLVGYGADPGWVLDTVMEHASRGAYVLMGNHDIALLQDARNEMNAFAYQVIEWTRAQLTPAHLQFIRDLPFRIEMEDLLFVHANAWAPEKWEYIDGTMDAMRSMHATHAQVTFCGHVHLPSLYHMTMTSKTGEFIPAPNSSLLLSKQRRWLVIPGSTGQPRDGNPAACYATFDTVTRALTYYRVPYDTNAAAEKIIAAGLPAILGKRLIVGA